MISTLPDGVYLYLSQSAGDGPWDFDHWFESVADAEEAAAESFGIGPDSWVEVVRRPDGD